MGPLEQSEMIQVCERIVLQDDGSRAGMKQRWRQEGGGHSWRRSRSEGRTWSSWNSLWSVKHFEMGFMKQKSPNGSQQNGFSSTLCQIEQNSHHLSITFSVSVKPAELILAAVCMVTWFLFFLFSFSFLFPAMKLFFPKLLFIPLFICTSPSFFNSLIYQQNPPPHYSRFFAGSCGTKCKIKMF